MKFSFVGQFHSKVSATRCGPGQKLIEDNISCKMIYVFQAERATNTEPSCVAAKISPPSGLNATSVTAAEVAAARLSLSSGPPTRRRSKRYADPSSDPAQRYLLF